MRKVYKKVVTSFKMQLKRRYFMLLKKEVVESGLKRRRGECLGCGTCVIRCPQNALNTKPVTPPKENLQDYFEGFRPEV